MLRDMFRKCVATDVSSPLSLPAMVTTETQPRLFVTDKDRNRLSALIQKADSPHGEIYQLLRHRQETNAVEDENRSEDNWNYARSYKAQTAAFLYWLTGEDRFAQQAYETLCLIHCDPDPTNRLIHRGYGLSRSTVGMGFALAYDWCRNGWSSEQADEIKTWLIRGLDSWLTFDHHNFHGCRGSNWVAVCRGGELIMLLAARLDRERADRYDFLKEQLSRHLDSGYGPLGVTQEGIGYCSYAGIYLQAARQALLSVGDDSLEAKFQQHAWWQQAMWAGCFVPMEAGYKRRYLQSGVAGEGTNDEGWCSLLIPSVPEESLPEYMWWYDRHMGPLASGDDLHRYDVKRQGLIWSLLYYPQIEERRDPAKKLGRVGCDEKLGTCYFRNQFKDESDLLFSVTGKAHQHGRAWSQPEALALNLIAHGNRFIAGPEKYRDPWRFSSLLVDGLHHAGSGASQTGTFESCEVTATGGQAVVTGGQQYRDLGVTVTRTVEVDFDLPMDQCDALLVVRDAISCENEHDLTFNINVGCRDDYDGIQIEMDDAGRSFLLSGERNAWLRGWVLSPDTVTLQLKESLQITTRSNSTEFVVAMLVGTGQPATCETLGQCEIIQQLKV